MAKKKAAKKASKTASSKKAGAKTAKKASKAADGTEIVNMSFANPDTIEADTRLTRTVSSVAFGFGMQDSMAVRIGDGTFTSEGSGAPPKAGWLTGTFVNDRKVSIDFVVAKNLPAGPWKVYLEHTADSTTTNYESDRKIVFVGS